MKKRLLALSLTLALCLGLLVLPAGAITYSDAEIYLQKVQSHKGASYLVDFDGDGREELVLTKSTNACIAEIWQGDTKLGETVMDPGLMGYGHLYLGGKGGKVYLGSFCGEIRGDWEEYCIYTVENGKWVEKKRGSRDPYSYEWSMKLDYSSKTASAQKRLKAELKALEWTMPQVPDVPAAPLGGGLTPAPAGAIEALKNVAYHGDRAAITMTADQANAILGQMAYYASVTTNPSYPDAGEAVPYAALFDTGAGVPGLFMGKLYSIPGESPYVSGGQAVGYWGECALWTFQNGQLTLFSPATYSLSYTLYPACVEQDISAPDGSYTELRYFAMNYGSLSTTPATTVVKTPATASVDGVSVSQSKADEFISAWRGTGRRAYATEGGGVEYIIGGMTPVAEMTAALQQFVAACAAPAPIAYPSAQSVRVDGVDIPFQFYALKDQSGNDTNYIKLRDIAYVLNGTAAQFEVGWDGAVSIQTGKPYTPNNSEMSTPFSGQRSYAPAAAQTRVNGKAADLEAIVLTDDAGGAYTYYKLRDLGTALGFTVDWSAQNGICIQTK